jgi:hypothetical protein
MNKKNNKTKQKRQSREVCLSSGKVQLKVKIAASGSILTELGKRDKEHKLGHCL